MIKGVGFSRAINTTSDCANLLDQEPDNGLAETFKNEWEVALQVVDEVIITKGWGIAGEEDHVFKTWILEIRLTKIGKI